MVKKREFSPWDYASGLISSLTLFLDRSSQRSAQAYITGAPNPQATTNPATISKGLQASRIVYITSGILLTELC